MMICKADFEELFPEIFPTESHNGRKEKVQRSNLDCLVRWEDDSDRLSAAPAPNAMECRLSAQAAAS